MAPTPTSYIVVHGGAGVHGVNHEKELKKALRRACLAGLGNNNQSDAQTPSSPFMKNEPVHPHTSPTTSWPKSVAPLSGSEFRAGADGGGSDNQDMLTCDAGPRPRDGEGSGCLTMVERAIIILENDERFNAGYGSNLTLDGTVECDAAIMCARGGLFGSIGAVSGVRNPIQVARAVLDHSRIPSAFGRIPPLLLVSSGARNFAENRGIEIVPAESLIAPGPRTQWKKWTERLETFERGSPIYKVGKDDGEEKIGDIQDTVGAIALHFSDGFAAGVSSGGLLLKHPGRVGEAGVFGAGCWASQTQTASSFDGMACSISGAGEYIVRENLARKIGDAFSASDAEDPHGILHGILLDFWDSSQSRGEIAPAVGVIVLTSDRNASVRLWCAFTAASMAVGYMTSRDEKPKTVIFRHPQSREDGKPRVYITSISLSK